MPEKLSRDHLMAAVWDLQFEHISHEERMARLGLPETEYRRIRGEALVTFEPTPDQIRRLMIPDAVACH